MDAEANVAPRTKNAPFHVAGLLLVVAAVGGVALLGARRHEAVARDEGARQQELALGPRVQTAKVAEAAAGRTVTVTGEVHPLRQATLYAKVSGYLRDVRVEKGDTVRAGQVLGVLESPETEQEVLSKKADLANKKVTEDRYKALAQNGLVSQQELDRAYADRTIADTELARVAALKGYQVLKAPFDGVVTARLADPGALLQAATSSQSALPLVEVSDMSRVRVQVFLGQSEALFVHEKDPVTLWADAMPDKKIKATVTRFSHELDPRTRTMLTEIELDNRDAGFYPGTFVRVQMQLATPRALSVPEDAIVFRGGKPVVARVQAGHAQFVPVELGDSDGQTVRLRGGLDGGDVVVRHPGDDVVDGGPVQAVPSAVASAK